MLIPSPLLVSLLLLWLASAVAVCIWPMFILQWLGLTALLGIVALSDALLAARRVRIEVRRVLPGSAPLGVWLEVRLRVHNHDRITLAAEVFDHYPDGCAAENQPRRVTVAARGWV